MTRLAAGLVAVLVAGAAAPPASHADTVTRARITVDATGASSIRIETGLTVRAEGGSPRRSVDLFLERSVEVVDAAAGGREAPVRASEVPGTLLRRWTVELPAPIGAGDTGEIDLVTRASAPSGALLPGTGWFPQLAPETDELPVHTTTFRLPAGQTGVAAGAGGGPWTTTVGARPFAVWGELESTRTGGSPSFEVWRRPGRSGPVPRADVLARLATVLAAGMSADEEIRWKLVDVGSGPVAGGRGAVLWDEGSAAAITERDLAGALAATFWTEQFRTVGAHAAWLSRSVAAYLGDVACIALDDSDQRHATEAAVISPRRDAFVADIASDRPIAGVVPVSADGPRCLETRGALLAHALAEAAASRSRWLVCLGGFRREYAGATVDLATFRAFVGRTFYAAHDAVWPLFETTDLPRFRIASHGPATGFQVPRYRVDVENGGTILGSIEVATFSAAGHRMRANSLLIPPGGSKAVAFDLPEHIARIELDPRGVALQSALEDQVVTLSPTAPPDAFVPSFEFVTQSHVGRAVENFSLELEGISIKGFDGWVAAYSTYHGPSGATLVGQGELTIAPDGPFAAGFEKRMGTKRMVFPAAKDLWIRFPPSAWERIEPQLGEEAENDRELFKRRQQVHSSGLQSYYFEGTRAQVPPPGSAVVVFLAADAELRGFARRPQPDGRVEMRLWDQRRRDTIWEETH